jgi:prophage regulatory protein
MSVSVLRLPQVKTKVGLSRSSIYAAVAGKTFPAPIRLGARAVGWLESELDAWLANQIERSRA